MYRLVTKATYEQGLFETSAKKYGLDDAVLGGVDGAGSCAGVAPRAGCPHGNGAGTRRARIAGERYSDCEPDAI